MGKKNKKCVMIHFGFHHNPANTQFDIKESERAQALKKTSVNQQSAL